jgi:Hemolysin coregulated protein Hcp (TssD)
MSFQAKLFLNNASAGSENTYTVLYADYALSVGVDANHRPNSRVRGGLIELTIEASNSSALTSWISTNQALDGKVEFYHRERGTSTQKSVQFSRAYCIFLKDVFVANGSTPMVTKITISAHQLDIDTVTFTNTWEGVDSPSEGPSESSGGDRGSTDSNSVSFDDD